MKEPIRSDLALIEPIRLHFDEAQKHSNRAAVALEELRAWEARYRACPDCEPMVNAIATTRAALELALRRAYVPPPGAPYAVLYRSRRRYEQPTSLWPGHVPLPRRDNGPQWRRHFIPISEPPSSSHWLGWFAIATVCRDWAPVPEDYLKQLAAGQMVTWLQKDWERDRYGHTAKVIVDGDVFITPLWAPPPRGVVETCLDCERKTRSTP